MTQYVINIGALPNDGTGDPLRTAFNEVNLNFNQVWATGLVNSNIQIANNTILTTNTNGNLVLNPNGVGNVVANAHVLPDMANVRNLGSAGRRWSEIYTQYLNITGNVDIAGTLETSDLTVNGNLTVTGNTIQIGNLVTDAKTLQLANTAGTANAADGSGITVGANDNIATFLYNSADNAWTTNIAFETGNLILTDDRIMDLYGPSITNADLISGSTSGLDIVPNGDANATVLYNTYGNIQLQTSNTGANVKTFTFDYTGNISVPGAISAVGNITGNYFIGNGSQLTGITTYANANAVSYGETGWAGNIVPATSNTYSLGNSSLWWSNVWVAGNTMYIGGVPIGMAAGNTLTVDGNSVVTVASNTTANLANIGIDNNNIFNNQGQGVVISNFSFIDEAETAYVQIPAGNSSANLNIVQTQGNVRIAANAAAWVFDDTGNLTLPTDGSIVVDGGDGVIGPVSDDLVISWDNEEIRLVSVQGSIEMQADAAFRVQSNYDGANVLYASRWEFGNNELVNISNNFGIVSEAGNLTLSGGRDGVNSGNTMISAVNLGTAVYNWTFGNDGNLTLPSEGNIVGITPNNAGRIQWVGNSSGDGFGYTTLGLIPDETLVGNDQYLIIDPTAPGHIHIRAGGTQDNSSADLFLGGENSYFRVNAGANAEVQVTSNSNTWVFNTDGNLQVPGNINGDNNAPLVIDGASAGVGYISLPHSTFGGEQIAIVNKFALGNGIRLETNGGNLFFNDSADLSVTGNITGNYFIGDGNQLSNVNAVTVDVTDTNGLTTIYYPTFVENRANAQIARADVDLTYRTDDNLLTVGNVSVTGNVTGNYFIGNGSQLTGLPAGYANSDVANFMAAFGSNSISTTGNVTANNISGNILVTGNVTGTTPNVTLIAGSYSWTFDNTGNLQGNVSFTGGNITINNAPGGNEGAEIQWALPAPANTVLNTSVIQDVYQNGMRFFESGGNSRGLYMDLGNVPNGATTAVGYRDIPQISFTGNTTTVANAAGRHYYSTQSTDYVLTIANNTSVSWSVGTAITIVNRGTGNMTIAQGTGVSLYLAGNSTAGNRTVTTYGMATLLNVAANVWMINGTGVS